MRRALAYLLVAALAAACDSTEPSVPTEITITPQALTFDAIGAVDTVVAAVFDQRGDQMFAVPLTWSTEGSAASVTPLTGDSAVVTTTGPGTAIVRATAESATGEAVVTVTQVPTSISIVGGTGQSATAGIALPNPITVAVRDRLGAGVPGRVVTFTVTQGGGSLSAATATTGPDGTASVTWTLGTNASAPQTVTATTEGVIGTVTFVATATAGAPASIAIHAGNGQTITAGSNVPIQPAVRVTDQFNNPVPGVTVTFEVVSGGGSVVGATTTTNAEGVAAVGNWRLGSTVGPNVLRAFIPGTNLSVTFNATGSTTAGSQTLAYNAGNNQAAMVSTAVPIPPSVRLRDAAGNPVPGVTVNFDVIEGGGSVTVQSTTTDANGVASAGNWVLGPVGGPNRLRATATGSGIQNNPLVFTSIGCSGGGGGGFAITLCFTTTVTATQRQVFENAAQRWATVITGDLQNVPVSGSNTCGAGTPFLQMTVDDVLIFAGVENIDGPGQILGQASPCRIRNTGNLPVVGFMEFDSADLGTLQTQGTLQAVILHEMGHVLGIGTLWDLFGLLEDESTSSNSLDTFYDGPGGIAGFNEIGGATYTGGRKVPVENTQGGEGTLNSHWRENVLKNELMTGFVNNGSNPLSRLTVRSLTDMGYAVDPDAADPFNLVLTVRASGSPGTALHLRDDIMDIPIWTVDGSGRNVRRVR